MADVGRSTLSHYSESSSHVLDKHLQNWGAWIVSIPAPHAVRSISGSAVCQMYVARYVDDQSDNPPSRAFDGDTAQALDLIIAQSLRLRHIEALVCRYVTRVSSREAARHITLMGYECTHTTYRRWLDDAFDLLTDKINA